MGLTKDCHGGLMTLSKFPILDEFFTAFPEADKMKISERIGSKGFITTKIVNQEQDTLIIINTHLYAGGTLKDESHRMRQISYMDSVLNAKGLYNYRCILSGDLNVEHPQVARERNKPKSPVYDFVIKKMDFVDSAPELMNDTYTIDPGRNYYNTTAKAKQKLDYILTRKELNEESRWSVASANSEFGEERSYSDHLAFRVRYDYN